MIVRYACSAGEADLFFLMEVRQDASSRYVPRKDRIKARNHPENDSWVETRDTRKPARSAVFFKVPGRK